MFNNELRNSVINILNETFEEIYSDFLKEKGDSAQSPDEIAKIFPIEIIAKDDIFEVLHEAIQKKTYGHFGYFSKYEPSTVARDTRRITRKVFSDFKEIVCFRGEIYERVNNCWIEKKLYKDINDRWHLWDGSYNIQVWIDGDKRSFTTNPPKPTKKYPIES